MGGGILPGPAQIQGGGGGGGSVPSGGTSGQLLAKLSNANQDAGWVDPSLASNATPLADSGTGGPGVGTGYARPDHFHPASAQQGGGSDAYTVCCATNPLSGDIYYFPWINAGITLYNDARDNSMPFRLTATATYLLGVKVTGGGSAGSLVRLGVFADDANARGPGTLTADLGTVVTTGTGIIFTAASVALQSGTRYWAVVQSEGNAVSQPTLSASPTLFNPVTVDGGGNPGLRYNWGHAGAFTSNPTVSVDPNPMPTVFFKVA